jgi:hypothetical protein
MTDTASRVYGPAALTGSNATLYTVPSVTTAIIRNIHISNTSAADATVSLAINGTSATAANCFLKGFTIPAFGEYDWNGFMVLATTDTLQGLSGTASVLAIIVSAVLVT